MRRPERISLGIVMTALVLTTTLAQTEKPPGSAASEAEEQAKQLTNPVADLVSVPLELNLVEGVGVNHDLMSVMKFQPVVPFSLNANWNLIGRLILPFVNQPVLAPGVGPASGTGDILLSGFFSPVNSKKAIWGVGPALSLPTTSDPLLGSGKWSGGPTAVVLKLTGPWAYGTLVNHLWSFADTGDQDRTNVSQSYLQPFLAYTTPAAVTYLLSSETTYDWKAADGQKWTAPILVNVSKVTRLGPFPFSIGAGAGYYLEKPDGGPDWSLRMTATLILPRKR
jgi:hypothetical protein